MHEVAWDKEDGFETADLAVLQHLTQATPGGEAIAGFGHGHFFVVDTMKPEAWESLNARRRGSYRRTGHVDRCHVCARSRPDQGLGWS